MASYHFSHHHHHCHHPTTTTTSTLCCCTTTACTPSHHPPVPDPYPPQYDHPSPQTHAYNPYPGAPIPNPSPPYSCQCFRHHQPPQTPCLPPPSDLGKDRYFQQPDESAYEHPIVASLVRRIAALESSLHRHSSSHSRSLRDAATRTIQRHFRAFLVRRSRTLGLLKQLASIKLTLKVLKSSVSDDTRFDPRSLSHKASKLQFKLDSVQGGDPMIRDGKKSIRRELNSFLNLIDGSTGKRSEISTGLVRKNAVKKDSGGFYGDHRRGSAGCADSENDMRLEDLFSRVDVLYDKVQEVEGDDEEGISTVIRNSRPHLTNGDQAKVKKSVRFVENGKVFNVSRNSYAPGPDSCDGNASSVIVSKEDNYVRKAGESGGISFSVTEDDKEDESQDGDSARSSDGEGGPANALGSGDGSYAYSAPLPLKIDSRTDMKNTRKFVK